ncbi:unnamed protein product [Echinostoma caproni]|uniref:Death domain-containing protein n=1 Tax=Echinostoma caproni TaxID=27848 RepID=A0A183AHF6_9TREM|nr:unnamed protein product [Echinostoma caproni]
MGLRGTNENLKDTNALVPLHNYGAATKMLRLAAFSSRLTPTMDYNIRVYVLSDTKDALKHVCSVESRLDGRLLDSTKPFPFRDNGIGLSFRIEDVSPGWRSRLQTRIQEIPFRHIWSGTQMAMLHCAFSLEHVDPAYSSVSCHILVYQENTNTGCQSQHQLLEIMSENAERPNPLFPRSAPGTRSGPYVEDPISTTPIQPFRLPWSVRRRICESMEHSTTRENDWRVLAVQLGMERHIIQLATKNSPTNSLLDLWEAQHRHGQGLEELKYKLINIGRIDCANIIEFETAQIWDKR